MRTNSTGGLVLGLETSARPPGNDMAKISSSEPTHGNASDSKS